MYDAMKKAADYAVEKVLEHLGTNGTRGLDAQDVADPTFKPSESYVSMPIGEHRQPTLNRRMERGGRRGSKFLRS